MFKIDLPPDTGPTYAYTTCCECEQLRKRIAELGAELEHQKKLYAAHIGDEHENCGMAMNESLKDDNERLKAELKKHCNELFNRGFVEGMNEIQKSKGGNDFRIVWPTTKASKAALREVD